MHPSQLAGRYSRQVRLHDIGRNIRQEMIARKWKGQKEWAMISRNQKAAAPRIASCLSLSDIQAKAKSKSDN